MSFGSTAYETFVRIHVESGRTRLPPWNHLTHLRRLAWEAAAQAVAMAILPEFSRDDEEEVDEDVDMVMGDATCPLIDTVGIPNLHSTEASRS